MKDMNELSIEQLDQLSGGIICFNEWDGVYDVLDDDTLDVRASFLNLEDAQSYCHRHDISDFEISGFIILGF